MKVVYAFIGKLPPYSIDTLHQLRLFFDGDVYFIVNDYDSEYIPILKNTYNVNIIRYDMVADSAFNDLINAKHHKFCIIKELTGREKLFIHAFERFYLLSNLMKVYQLTDILFLELDNLIYNDPETWLEQFKQKDMAYMFDHYNRASSGIAYIKNTEILSMFLDCCTQFIQDSNDFMTEMTTLYYFWEKNRERVQLLPIHWKSEVYPLQTYNNVESYNSIFDALAIGVYLAGVDPHHTHGNLIVGYKSTWSLIDYTKYTFKWENDEKGRKIPYVQNGDNWLRINNLHVHSKHLKSVISLPIEPHVS
jgi:hypothetical protein